MSKIIANFGRERQAFRDLLDAACVQRIMLLQGEAGSGKTSLINHCLAEIGETVKPVPIELRDTVVGVAEIFSRIGRVIGWERLSRFARVVSGFQEKGQVYIRDNKIMGQNNSITVALHAEDFEGREERRVRLTDACFDDLAGLDHLTLIILDTYERANTEVQQWIEGPFLSRVTELPGVRVLIAGQVVPEENNIEWGHCCRRYPMLGITNAADWMPIVKSMKRYMPFDNSREWLSGVCDALKGRPSDIMKVIEALPQRESLP